MLYILRFLRGEALQRGGLKKHNCPVLTDFMKPKHGTVHPWTKKAISSSRTEAVATDQRQMIDFYLEGMEEIQQSCLWAVEKSPAWARH